MSLKTPKVSNENRGEDDGIMRRDFLDGVAACIDSAIDQAYRAVGEVWGG